MSVLDVIRRRYSVRAYKPDPVPQDLLNSVLEAARIAPTAANRQAFSVLVIRTEVMGDALHEIYRPVWFTQAPLVLAVVGIPEDNWVRRDARNYVDVDAAIVMDHMVLAATDLGLGTCWIGAFDPEKARKLLRLPAHVEPIAFTPLGYSADAPGDKKRKSLDELVRYDTWE